MNNIIFIHGLESSGQGFKGNLFRKIVPKILTPDFTPFSTKIPLENLLQRRMSELETIVHDKSNWTVIGSSFGGLMATIYVLKYPEKVKLLILLAPFLNTPLLKLNSYNRIDIPVIIFHGKKDIIVPLEKTQKIAEILFTNLIYNVVDDDHQLQRTVSEIDWSSLLSHSM
jgi:pimeloyl-ACP methyl ester carboxylesterase